MHAYSFRAAADALYIGLITWATDDSKSSGSAPFSLAIFFRAGIILARRSRSESFLQHITHLYAYQGSQMRRCLMH